MKRLLLITIILLQTICSLAVPAQRRTFNAVQKDGTTITLMMVGDECFHYYINVATNEKMQKGKDGYYYVISDDIFAERKAAAELRRNRNNQLRAQRLQKNRRAGSGNGQRRVGAISNSITGDKKGLIILVNFSDKQFVEDHDHSTFADMFNKVGYNENNHIGSVHDYFYDQSYGNFNLSFDVIGPITLSNTMAYYGGNDSRGDDKHPAEMAKEACQFAYNQGVNFADYDWDGDNIVEQVYIIYAGYGENYVGADENTIWPHEWSLSDAGVGKLVLDGITIDTYACSAELSGSSGTTLNGIGTACHEFSHCLGYPDLYDTDYSGGIGMSSYDIMDSGNYNGPNHNGEVPVGFTAYERAMAGWLTPIELNGSVKITDMPALNDEPVAYIIYNEGNKDEYLMLENRQANRWFQYFSNANSGHGLFVIHVDENASIWASNKPNDIPSHQRLTWIAADNNYGTYNSSNKDWTFTRSEILGDFFPGNSNTTSLTNTSHLNVGGKMFNKNTDGSYYINHELTDISENTNSGTISFSFDSSLYTITYDPCNETGESFNWTQSEFQEATELPSPQSTDTEWTFAGWTTSPIIEESTSAPAFVEVINGKYTPTQDVTLFAVYKKATENGGGEEGFKLKMEKNGEDLYIGNVNTKNYRFETTKDDGIIFNFKDGKLSFEYNGATTYVVPKNPNSNADLEFVKEKPSKANWTLITVDEGVMFKAVQTEKDVTIRYLGLNGNYVKSYAESYSHVWNRYDIGGNIYTSYPTVTITTLVRVIDKLKEKDSGHSLNNVQKIANRIISNTK